MEKVDRLQEIVASPPSNSIESPTVMNSISNLYEELDDDDEEIVTYTEVLNIMGVEVPENFRKMAEGIILRNKIPISKNDESNKTKNRFLCDTFNRKMFDICEVLTLDEICS